MRISILLLESFQIYISIYLCTTFIVSFLFCRSITLSYIKIKFIIKFNIIIASKVKSECKQTNKHSLASVSVIK